MGLDFKPVGLDLKPVGLELEPAGLEFGPKLAWYDPNWSPNGPPGIVYGEVARGVAWGHPRPVGARELELTGSGRSGPWPDFECEGTNFAALS